MDLSEVKSRLTGVVAFPVTPFLREPDGSAGAVDVEAVHQTARRLVDAGIRVMVPCGGTGEFYSLTPEEWRVVVRAVAEEVKDEAIVVAGIGHVTNIAVEMAKYAEESGCQAVMASPPPVGATEEGLYHHYARVAASTSTGVVLFRTPTAPVSQSLVARLARIPNVIAIKDEYGDIEWFRGVMEEVRDRLVGICGISEMMAPHYFLVGASAFSSGLCNIVPEISIEMYNACVRRDAEAIKRILQDLGPICRLRARSFYHISLVKEALEMLGYRAGPARLPLLPLAEPDRQELRRILRDLGVMGRGSLG